MKATIEHPELLTLINRMKSTGSRSLVFNGKQLTELPKEIEKLTKLTGLYLSNNELNSLPPEIGKLTRLQKLYLDHNKLTSIPSQIGSLVHITTLELTGNKLVDLPQEIGHLVNLSELNLSDNLLTNLPPTLTNMRSLIGLDLSNNRLSTIPIEILGLTRLKWIDLRGNKSLGSPEVFSDPQDVPRIFSYLRGLSDAQPLNEAKMLIVGDPKVGKTSLVRRLRGLQIDPTQQTTLGITFDEVEVSKWQVAGMSDVKLNIWDFGGQEIQHSTHKFFLTERSLYLLVLDARKGDQLGNVEYWLKLIQSFGGSSPIIVIINQVDQLYGQRPLNIDRKALQEKYNIKDFVETSCLESHSDTIETLKRSITLAVSSLHNVRAPWPRKWFAVKELVGQMQHPYITYDRYSEICRETGIIDDVDCRALLRTLHELGTVNHFPGDTNVINPRWVTQGVYGLLTSDKLVKSEGQLNLSDLGSLLDANPITAGHYPLHTHRMIIEIMTHFELCFEFFDQKGKYLIPSHLRDNELDIGWNDDDSLRFQYHYQTLPDAIISRLIVRMNLHIQNQYYWRNGVYLSYLGNRARIKADPTDRKIFISVSGTPKTRREFLAIIRSHFDTINDSFTNNIEITRWVPVPEHPNVLVSYEELCVHEEMGEKMILVKELRAKVPVKSLLDSYDNIRINKKDKTQLELGNSMSPSKNNPWTAGSFYLLAFVVIVATVAAIVVVLSKYGISWATLAALPVVVITGLLGVGIVGGLQLRNDERLADRRFVELMIESYKRLPLLRGGAKE